MQGLNGKLNDFRQGALVFRHYLDVLAENGDSEENQAQLDEVRSGSVHVTQFVNDALDYFAVVLDVVRVSAVAFIYLLQVAL